MPRSLSFPVTIVLRTLEEDLVLGEALLFPEASRLATTAARVVRGLQSTVANVLEALPRGQLHLRGAPPDAELGEVTIDLPPPPRSLAWRDALALRFDVAHYTQASSAVAWIPALDIEVVGARRADVEASLAREIVAELQRRGASMSLPALIWLQRGKGAELRREVAHVTLPTLKEQARRRASDDEKKAVLPEIATDLTKVAIAPAYALDPSMLARALTAPSDRAVLLVGPSGAGKTALVRELVRTRASTALRAVPFWETSGARIVAGSEGFGGWQERCVQMWREAAATRAVLVLGNLVELMEVGRHETSPLGIAGFLQPFIARGDVAVVLECTPEQRALVERHDGHLLQQLRQLPIEPPPADTVRSIMTSAARDLTDKTATTIEPEAVDTICDLHARFATYSAPPGRPLRFLRNLVADAVDVTQPRVTARDAALAFARETGLPPFLVDPAQPFEVARARAWFTARLRGQAEPIDLVVDALAAVKAALTRPQRPIASFLFVGPTGVGKTEMARCLAEFLFSDRSRMVRFDMSEYAHPHAVQRLVGAAGAAEGLLTAAVREHPFCVLLLDEVEKAHPLFFDLLLQVLGEARLTDAAGRLADFRNAVVILTSNLGAAGFGQAALGLLSDAARDRAPRDAARDHFVAAVRQALRPELFNRLDRIVPFAPLDRLAVEGLAEREVDALARRDGLRHRQVELEIGEGVTRHLAERGYEPRYGARPLKRAVEREIVGPLAAALNRYGDDVALRARVEAADGGLTVEVKARSAAEAVPRRRDGRLVGQIERLNDMRRTVVRLHACPVALEMQSELFRLEQPRRRWQSAEEQRREAARRQQLKAIAADMRSVREALVAAEDEAMLAMLAGAAWDAVAIDAVVSSLEPRVDDLLLAAWSQQLTEPHLLLAVYAVRTALVYDLAGAYAHLAARFGFEWSLHAVVTRRDKDSDGLVAPPLLPDQDWSLVGIDDAPSFLRRRPRDVLGLALVFEGPRALALLEPEAGQHVRVGRQTERALVVTQRTDAASYTPPADVTRRTVVENHPRRRALLVADDVLDDSVCGKMPLLGRDLHEATAAAVWSTAQRAMAAMLEGETRA